MSEQALRILLQLIDQTSGPAGDVAGSLGEVEEAAVKAGDATRKSLESSKNPLTELKSGLALVRQAFGMAAQVAAVFNESVQRLAESGDEVAIRFQESQSRMQKSLQETQDIIVRTLLVEAQASSEGRVSVQVYNDQQTAADNLGRALAGVAAALGGDAGVAARLAEINRVVGQAPPREFGDHLGLLEQRLGEVGGALHDGAGAFGDYAEAISRTNYKAGDLTRELQDQRQAVEDLKLSQLDGILAIAAHGRAMDEAFAEAHREGVKLSAEEITRLTKGLFDAAGEAVALGKSIPLAEVDNLQDSSENLRKAIAGMSGTDAEKAALLAYLDLANEKLAAAESHARNASLGIGAVGVAPNAPPEGTTAAGDVQMAGGGTIAEPVVGRGLNTGRRYMFGEGGTVEEVRPVAGGGGGGVQIIQLVVDGRVLAEVVAAHTARERGV